MSPGAQGSTWRQHAPLDARLAAAPEAFPTGTAAAATTVAVGGEVGSLEHWGKALDGREDCSPLLSSSGMSSGGSDVLTPPASTPRAGTQLTWDVLCTKPVEGVDHNIYDDGLAAEGGQHSSGVNAAHRAGGMLFLAIAYQHPRAVH